MKKKQNKTKGMEIAQKNAMWAFVNKYGIKALESQMNGFRDINHADGSKSYQNVSGGYITIKRPEVVKFVEETLSGNFLGWGYMPRVDKALEDGIITKEEYKQIIKILD